MQVLKVDSEITVLYKIIITVFFNYYQNTPSFLAPLYIFCVFEQAPLKSFSYSTWRNQRGGLCPPMSPDPSDGYLQFPLLCHAFKCPSPLLHNVVKSCGSSPTRATSIFLGYRYIHGKTCLLHHLLFKTCMWHRKWWGAGNGVWWYPKRLNLTFFAGPIKSFFFSLFLFSQGSRRAQLQTQTSGWRPQSQST